jgi:DNA invertase Pin-like site-specific DNA recombinase
VKVATCHGKLETVKLGAKTMKNSEKTTATQTATQNATANTVAFSYVRFSTAEQLKGDSLRRQTQAAETYAKNHGLTLDTSFSFRDLGVSAFKGKNVKDGALGSFLTAVENGKVPQGATLIVENLDRLSRSDIETALRLLLSIIDLGVIVVTLVPEQRYEKGKMDLVAFYMAIGVMQRANEESEMKSKRLSASWQNRRTKAQNGEIIRATCPSWLEYNATAKRYEVIEEKAETVRRIFKMSQDGNGIMQIAKQLNTDGTKPLCRKSIWIKTTINETLHNRATLGEYQPHIGRSSNRKKIGEVIQGYYPPILTEAEYYAAQTAIAQRTRHHGPRGKSITNLFGGLTYNERGDKLMIVNRGPKYRYLVSTAAMNGAESYDLIPYAPFEQILLTWLMELKSIDAIQNDTAREMAVAEGKLADITARIEKINEAMATGDMDSLLTVHKTLEANRKAQAEIVEQLKAKAQVDGQSDLEQGQDMAARMAKTEGAERETLRTKLRQVISGLVKQVKVTMKKNGTAKELSIKVELSNTIVRYIYATVYRNGTTEIRQVMNAEIPWELLNV